jgi:NADH-quinone oxidoreductase subunit M
MNAYAHLLTWLAFLPLVGALLLVLIPGKALGLLRWTALATSLVVALLALFCWQRFDPSSARMQMATPLGQPWFTLPGTTGPGTPVHFRLGVDGISLLMVVFTGVLMPVVMLSTWSHVRERVKEFLVWMLVMETGMLGVFLACDLVLFYVFWEVSLIPLYFLVGIWGGANRLYATIKFFLYTLAGSLVMLVGVIALIWRLNTSDIAQLSNQAAHLSATTQLWFFAAFALAFAIKVPLVPFHTWLADAHTEAPTSGSVVLAGVLLKMGTYGLVRFGIGMFPLAATQSAPLFMAVGAVGILYGALLAMAQTDLKRLIACSSVSHLGYVVLGLFALNPEGIGGGMLQMVNHGISTGLLFLLVGMIYERRHTRQLDQFGGLAGVMPLFAIVWVISVLASAGLPGLNGFAGEYPILAGAFRASPAWTALALSGVVFGAVYLLSATRSVLFGSIVHEANRRLRDMDRRELVLVAPLLALAVWIGLHPDRFVAPTRASVDLLVRRVERARLELGASAQADASQEARGRRQLGNREASR